MNHFLPHMRNTMIRVKPVLWLQILCLLQLVHSQNNKIKDLLDLTDFQVQEIANQAVSNLGHICDSLVKCTPSTCMRQACMPQGRNEIQSLTFLNVSKNPGCCSSCHQLRVSTTNSYIRISPLALEGNYEFQKSICAQKPLNQKLEETWKSRGEPNKAWVFFGAAEGYLYTFPGRDFLDGDQCSNYDPRRRPWYINMLAVVKSLYILMDTSTSMSNPVEPLSSSSCSDVVKTILMELLNTLTNGDQVVISTISGELIGAPVSVSLQGIDSSQNQSDIISLKEAVKKIKVDNKQNDVKQALSKALQFFKTTTDLKVLLVFTSGQFASNLNFTDMSPVLGELNEANVAVFLYRIGYDSSNDANLTKMQNNVNMTFEIIKDEDNPLWKVQSYLDYIAWIRFVSVQKRPVWVPVYDDRSGLGNVTTSAYPAFDANQRLIGVAAIDIIVDSMMKENGLQEAVYNRSATPSRQQAFFQPKPVTVHESSNCTVIQLTPVCQKKDLTSSISDYVCCESNCSSDRHTDLITSVAAAISTVAAVLVFAIVLVVILKKRRRRKLVESMLSLNKKPEWITPDTSPFSK